MTILIAIAVISIIGNLIGLIITYKYLKADSRLDRITQSLIQTRADYNRQFSKRLLFIHHSVGENLLYEGGLKDSLELQGIGVHSATYGSDIGQNTDMCDWVSKFDNNLEKMVKYDTSPDILYPDKTENDIIIFKSCFPNSDIGSEGVSPGDPFDKAQTVWNYKAVFENLKGIFSKKPEKLFIYMTSPPNVPKLTSPENAARAREFNNWVKSVFIDEYKKQTGLLNFMVFDLFDELADNNNFLRPEYRISESDSHPNAAGNQEASRKLMQFIRINRSRE